PDDPLEVTGVGEVEHDDGDVVLTAKRYRRMIHHAQVFVDQVKVAEPGKSLGLRIRHWVRIIDAVDLGRLEHDLRLDLDRPERGRRIGAEVGIAAAGGEDHNAALLQV